MERDNLIRRVDAILQGTYSPPPKAPFDVDSAALWGGISGIVLPVDHFEILPGLVLERTYGHMMAPFVMAFARPEGEGLPHPGPWASLRGQVFDVLAAVKLDEACRPLAFDRLNTLWFVVALLRLRLAIPAQMVILSDRSLQDVPADVGASNIVDVELHRDTPNHRSRREPNVEDLEWIRSCILDADHLMKTETFNRSFQTFDQAHSISHSGAGIVIAWASIETLLRPGQHKITERVSRALAAYLYAVGPSRDRAFQEISRSYGARGGAAHAGAMPEKAEFENAFGLARAALMRSIQDGTLPDMDSLLVRWKTKS